MFVAFNLTQDLLENKPDGMQRILEFNPIKKVLTEESAKAILAQHRIKIPRNAMVTTEDEAIKCAKALGFPLVGKVISPEILHKTDVNAIKMGLGSEEEVRQWFRVVYADLARQYDVKGLLLEEMMPLGVELIIGLQNSPQFGPVIMVGMGGVYAEIIKDVQFRVLPITRQDAIDMIENLRWKRVLTGFRGSQSINIDMLADIILRIGDLGIELAPHYESIDINPLIVYPRDYCAVDCKMILEEKRESRAFSTAQPNATYIDLFFDARSIAIVGASPQFGKLGNAILQKIMQGEYQGKIFPVNSEGYSEIMGFKAYKSIDDINEIVDLVIVTVDLTFVPEVLESCEKKGIHNMVILPGGGKEIGGERAIIEQQIRSLARKHKVRIIGPNCIGLLNTQNYLDFVFQGYYIEEPKRLRKGNISFLSQSGTFGAAFMESSCEVLNLNKLVTYGNRLDVDEADLIEYLAQDPETRVIGMYFEGLEDGRKFINTAERVIHDYKKPIIAFKNNRTPTAAKQSALHNGSLASPFEITKGALHQTGVISVDSYEELLGSLKALSLQPIPTANRVAMITNGGGAAVAALDCVEDLGLRVAQISELTKNAFVKNFPLTYVSGNPCDLTCIATAEDYEFAIEKFMEDPNVDIIMLWFVPWLVLNDHPMFQERITEVLAKFEEEKKKPILVGTYSQTFSRIVSKRIEKLGIPVYHSINTWMSAASNLAKCSKMMQSKIGLAA